MKRQAMCGGGEIAERGILGDDERVQAIECALGGVGIAFEENAIGKHHDPQVGIDPPFAVEPEARNADEGVEPLLGGLEFLRDHPVQELEAIGARDFEHGALREIEEEATLANGGVLEFQFAVRADEVDGLDMSGAGQCFGGGGRRDLVRSVGKHHRAGLVVEGLDGALAGHWDWMVLETSAGGRFEKNAEKARPAPNTPSRRGLRS